MAAAADKRLQQEKSRGMIDLKGYKRKQAWNSPRPGKKMRPDLAMEMKNLVNLVCRISQTYILIITELCSNPVKLL